MRQLAMDSMAIEAGLYENNTVNCIKIIHIEVEGSGRHGI